DNVTIGSGTRGPVTEEIQSRFFDVVEGKVGAYDDWFTPV
ncbi:MAG: branched-chain amino acid transaminase, partial [Halobacteriaceae archaeon]